jgi:aspartyl protease family protein
MARTYLIFILVAGLFGSMLGRCGSSTSSVEQRFLAKAREAQAGSSGGGWKVHTPKEEGTVELERDPDGHFYADVQINGSTVHMLVDTGATGIALSREDARSAGLATSIGMNEVVGQGADGAVRGEMLRLERVTLGHKTVEDISAVVLNSGETSLLGQSFLREFETVQIQGDKMVLR